MSRTLLFFVTEDWYFLSHRLPMARAAIAAGYDVGVVTNVSTKKELIEAEGIRVISFPMRRRSLNPFLALGHIARLTKIYRREKPVLVHQIALKPILFGSVAAWFAGVPHVLNAFAGLGVIFETDIPLARMLRPFLKIAFRILLRRKGSWTLFQNADDRQKLLDFGICGADRSAIIRGSGVEIERYAVTKLPPSPPFICVMAGRMIDAKGLPTLKEAFKLLQKEAPHIHLWLCGQPDPDNPGSWTEERLRQWCDENPNVAWKGHQNMIEIWPQVHLALQPSWGGEGLPKSLLEAGACARAMVATDMPGCREIVQQAINGFLIPPQDIRALAGAIRYMVDKIDDCAAMGRQSRRMVEGDLSATAVMQQTQALYQRITG